MPYVKKADRSTCTKHGCSAAAVPARWLCEWHAGQADDTVAALESRYYDMSRRGYLWDVHCVLCSHQLFLWLTSEDVMRLNVMQPKCGKCGSRLVEFDRVRGVHSPRLPKL